MGCLPRLEIQRGRHPRDGTVGRSTALKRHLYADTPPGSMSAPSGLAWDRAATGGNQGREGMTTDDRIKAWIKPKDDHVEAAFVAAAVPERVPAKAVFREEHHAREWIEREASLLRAEVEWMEP